MLWKIVGIASLGWGVVIFFILSNIPPPTTPEIHVHPNLEFTIYVFFLIWLVSSCLVKVNLILKKGWIKISILSCACFILLLLNIGLMQANIQDKIPSPENQSLYPYNLMAAWFISWFWIDMFYLLTFFRDWVRKRNKIS